MNDDEVGLVAELLGEAQAEGVDVADAYRVTTRIPYTDKPHETKTYTMPPQDLDSFFMDYSHTAEVLVDIRPVEEGDDA